ncbi:MAG: Sec-independent protein translocase protein TatB [Pseudomonadota bacterium]|jgi:sec-independent protein translocase protein TatB
MPQIGWSEILVIILVAIIVIGPKDLPVVVKKFIQIKNGIKNYVNSFQKSMDDIVEEHEKDIKKITDINIEEKNKDKSDKS